MNGASRSYLTSPAHKDPAPPMGPTQGAPPRLAG